MLCSGLPREQSLRLKEERASLRYTDFQGRITALEEAKAEADDQREEAARQVQHLQHELTHAQTHAAKHERDVLQVCKHSHSSIRAVLTA